MASALDGRVERRPWGMMHRAFPANPMFNGVWTEASPGTDWPDAVGHALAFFAEKATPLVFWWMTDASEDAELREALADHDFVPFELGAPALVGRIADLEAPHPHPIDLQIRAAGTEADLAAWRDVFVAAFGVPVFAAQAWCDATLYAGPEQAPWTMLVATTDGVPAGAGILYCSDGVALLIGMGVVAEYRRRGIGSALQIERGRIARARGCETAVLFASAMGLSPYRKLGFVETGETVSRYLWLREDLR
jgi:GNAT superfamily N-acetyltransferase